MTLSHGPHPILAALADSEFGVTTCMNEYAGVPRLGECTSTSLQGSDRERASSSSTPLHYMIRRNVAFGLFAFLSDFSNPRGRGENDMSPQAAHKLRVLLAQCSLSQSSARRLQIRFRSVRTAILNPRSTPIALGCSPAIVWHL